MITKRVIKLINNERMDCKIASAKACSGAAIDICRIESYDFAECSVSATDVCVKDYAGCTSNAFDYCGGSNGYDYHMCYAPNSIDTL